MNKKENSGYQKTHQRIQDILLTLIEKKPLKAITVNELCQIAQINRSTFYAHYTDIYAVMENKCEKLESDLITEYNSRYVNGTDILSNDYIILFVTHVKENLIFYKAYLSEYNNNALHQSMILLYKEIMQPIFLRMDVPERTGIYYFNFFTAGVITILRTWINDGCIESPAEISEIITSILPQSPEKLLVV